jgi:glutamate/tyrosine decarboxylase-like PLP-dependent enzyme
MERSYKQELECFQKVCKHGTELIDLSTYRPLPAIEDVSAVEKTLHSTLPEEGSGLVVTTSHLLNDIARGLNGSSLSSHYYGFVTGGSTPAARVADQLATFYDQNVQVHLPNQTVATDVEHRSLEMLLQLLYLSPQDWTGRTLTTGATASNIIGLACGRQWVIEHRLKAKGHDSADSVSELGMLKACRLAEIDDWQVLTTVPHSSLRKAASVVGLGWGGVIDVKVESTRDSLDFDMTKLERHLALSRVGSIVAISCGEVNSGWFATHSKEQVRRIRDLCDRYGAWLHVDGGKQQFLISGSCSLVMVSSFRNICSSSCKGWLQVCSRSGWSRWYGAGRFHCWRWAQDAECAVSGAPGVEVGSQ